MRHWFIIAVTLIGLLISQQISELPVWLLIVWVVLVMLQGFFDVYYWMIFQYEMEKKGDKKYQLFYVEPTVRIQRFLYLGLFIVCNDVFVCYVDINLSALIHRLFYYSWLSYVSQF